MRIKTKKKTVDTYYYSHRLERYVREDEFGDVKPKPEWRVKVEAFIA